VSEGRQVFGVILTATMGYPTCSKKRAKHVELGVENDPMSFRGLLSQTMRLLSRNKLDSVDVLCT
jgi:hypothetical protein